MNLKRQTGDLLCNYHHWTVKKRKKEEFRKKFRVFFRM